MIPEANEYLSFLMGADGISDQELIDLGVKIAEEAGSSFRRLIISEVSLSGYIALIREKLSPGYWNDIVGRQRIIFIFKLADSTIKERTLSQRTCAEIAQLCSSLNNDPLDKTSDVTEYLAGNPFYREVIESFHRQRPA